MTQFLTAVAHFRKAVKKTKYLRQRGIKHEEI